MGKRITHMTRDKPKQRDKINWFFVAVILAALGVGIAAFLDYLPIL